MYIRTKEQIVEASEKASCGAEASRMLGVPYKAYKRMAMKFGCMKKVQGAHSKSKSGTCDYRALKDFLDGKYANRRISSYRILKYLIVSGLCEYKCEECGTLTWNGRPIRLHVHHIDGNHIHNVVENIKLLCPNCHSQTDTYCGQNIKGRKREVSEFKKLLKDIVVYTSHTGNLAHDSFVQNDSDSTVLRNCSIKQHHRHSFISLATDNTEMKEVAEKSFSTICPKCGRERVTAYKPEEGSWCRKCRNASRHLQSKPDKETLAKEVSVSSFCSLARKYRTSNTTIKRWCKSYGIPIEKRSNRQFG